jgi:hypothetical protein
MSGDLTIAGIVVNVFLTLLTSLFIDMLLQIAYIDLDKGINANH